MALKLAVCVLIVRVVVAVVLNYSNYFPADFSSDFLVGRKGYFFGHYQWAFYTHISCGPCTLIFGLFLISDRFRIRHRKWHRVLGRIQTVCVLLLAISGLVMAFRAEGGRIATLGFAALSFATGLSVLLGVRFAIQNEFAIHRLWMSRCYVMLCSAVVLRLIGGLATIAEWNGSWLYQFSAWFSWLGPLVVYECWQRRPGRLQQLILSSAAVERNQSTAYRKRAVTS